MKAGPLSPRLAMLLRMHAILFPLLSLSSLVWRIGVSPSKSGYLCVVDIVCLISLNEAVSIMPSLSQNARNDGHLMLFREDAVPMWKIMCFGMSSPAPTEMFTDESFTHSELH